MTTVTEMLDAAVQLADEAERICIAGVYDPALGGLNTALARFQRLYRPWHGLPYQPCDTTNAALQGEDAAQ